MLFYSWVLTLIALAVLPIQVGLTLLGAPLFRRQYRKSAEANASTQSHLVEVLTGIQTVKSQNVEMISRWTWQERYGKYINRSFEKTITGTALSQTSQVLQKISQLLVLWVGASLVLSGDLTLGQLIAFRIIAGYVTGPLLRLSNLYQNFQQTSIALERLADIVEVHFPGLKAELLREALKIFYDVRDTPGLKKKPSTSELLDWLKLLMAEELPLDVLKSKDPNKLIPPMAGALLKNEQDVHLFERLAFIAKRDRKN